MKLLKKIINNLFKGKTYDDHKVPEYQETEPSKFEEKISSVFGEDKLKQQQLYEKWCTKENWNLINEAIPLAIGCDPENLSRLQEDSIKEKIQFIKEHAVHCVQHNLSLTVNDKNTKESEWQVIPMEFYTWASVSRVDMPEPMCALMEFIISTVKSQTLTTDRKDEMPSSPEATLVSQQFDKDNEIILGAAFALLAKYRDECMDSKGKIKPSLIIKKMTQLEDDLFNGKEVGLSTSAREDLLIKWMNAL